MAVILDNRSGGTVGEALTRHVRDGAGLSLLTNAFSIYAYEKLKDVLARAERVRLLLAPSALVVNEVPSMADAIGLRGGAGDRRRRNVMDTPRIAKECAEWLRAKAEVAVLHGTAQNVICIENNDGTVVIQGSASFDTKGLGFSASRVPQMNTLFTGDTETKEMLKWFDALWSDAGLVEDGKAHLLDQLQRMYMDRAPEEIYYVVLHHLFGDLLRDFDEERIVRTRTGIKDTIIWNKLYKFQRDGVLGAIDKIEKYNGCIIADSVGLGKTFEALAIIKYYELRNDRVLVLCPKKLRENWTLYTINDRRNLFAADRFNYDVLNHTDLTRTRGFSGEINLETLNWGNYDLVVIDESHNFRNNPSSGNVTRYSRLMEDIIRSGVKTKVLMLSATPVNNRMNDLKNQVAFITEGEDDALRPYGISSIESTLRRAQQRFNDWLKLPPGERTTQRLLDSLNMGYFKLLDHLTIARSRKHIVKYYDAGDAGHFPTRAKPINIKTDIDTEGEFPELRQINRDIRRLNLSTYSPLKYVLPHKRAEYSRKYDKTVAGGSMFKQLDREQSLIHLMRVNLLKRMESSIHSFGLTVERLLNNVTELIKTLDTHDGVEIEELNIEDIEVDEDDFAPHLVGDKIKVLIQDVDRIRWKQDLAEDRALLIKLLRYARGVDVTRDEKLIRLKNEIARKVRHPMNPGNRKILVFTAFVDTANYLYEHISPWAHKELGLHAALVTGASGGNKTTLSGIRNDMGSILTSFSPRSMERDKIDDTLTDEIDILIATDCISEGQNLQDCDYVINYDIHWNPVRIIQRFGRIDRFGSTNSVVQLVNFWPNLELDEYINLEARVSGRMVLLDISATGEENVIEHTEADKMNDLEYRRRQLEQLQNEVVDLEDLSTGVSITDLTLNDFRMDLVEHSEDMKSEQVQIPRGIMSAVMLDDLADEDIGTPGVVFCLRDESRGWRENDGYGLEPYYLVFVSWDGDVLLRFQRARQVLDLFRGATKGRAAVDRRAMNAFRRLTRDFRDMGKVQDLLAKAVAAITGEAEESGIRSLFERGGTRMQPGSFPGVDDFEVVAYLAIMDPDAAGSGGVQ